MLFNPDGLVYCPLCDDFFSSSPYLNSVFADNPRANWVSQMTTHYRHNHIRYYNKWVGYHSMFRDYETFKTEVNNRAKRNIIRKCKRFLMAHDITAADFAELQNTDAKTMKLARKALGDGPILPKETKMTTLDTFLD